MRVITESKLHTAEEQIRSMIGPEERIIWLGRPRQGLLFTRADLPMTMIYSAFLAFAVTIACFFFSSRSLPPIFYYCGMVLVIVASYCLFGRFIEDAMLRKRTRYVLTDQHLLISFGPYSGRSKTFSFHFSIPELPPQLIALTELPDLKLVDVQKDGTGTIAFGLPPIYRSFWGGRVEPAVVIHPRLELVEDAEDVYREILAAREKRGG